MAEKFKDVRYRNATSEGKKLSKLYDGDGLFLWVYEDGRKYWRLRYRLHGKEKLLSLGVYPDISLSVAREKAKIERDKIKNNIDPSLDRQINKQKVKEAASNSFKAVAAEWHAKQHIWTKTHSKSVFRKLEVDVFPYIGMYPISQIEAPQLLNMIRIIEKRGSYDLAHRVLGISGQIFRYGVSSGLCARDPAVDLRGALLLHTKRKIKQPSNLKSYQNYYEL